MTNRWGNNGNRDRFYLGGLQSYCSTEIKRGLLLERKDMIDLHGILKSIDITLLTKVNIVKVVVFLVVMYGCERT